MKIHCVICNVEFSIPPARLKTAKYCSRLCMGKAVSISKTGKTMSEETKERLKSSLKKKWASGTRKKNPDSMYEVTSAKMKEAYATGRMTYKPSKETREKALTARDMNKVRAAVRITGLAHRGVPNPIGSKNEAGPLNWKSKYWVIRSPDGIILRGKNLNHIIRENSTMFASDDVKFINSRCKASKGIRDLFLTKSDGKTPCAMSWNGWTAVLKTEEVEPTPHHGACVVTLPP
jgi:hypothetical protein